MASCTSSASGIQRTSPRRSSNRYSFTNAVALLKKGEVTSTPVQTAAGWHVIQLQNTRDRTPPAYDDVKDRLGKIVVELK